MHIQNRSPRTRSSTQNFSGFSLTPTFRERFFSSALVGLVTIVTLSSCASPEQKLKERQEKLEHFASNVVKHLLDRDPKTYRQSVAALMREELDDSTIDKLQSTGNLPEPGLEEMKVVSDAEDKKTSNTVETKSAQAVAGTLKHDVVPIMVTGGVINYQDGAKKNDQPFALEVDCKLTDEMQGYPRVVGVRGLENFTATSVRATTEPASKVTSPAATPHKRKTRRG
jgi:hypothetical protein